MIRDEKFAPLKKKVSEAEDSFAMVAKTLEEREATLHAKDAQLIEELNHL